jgi:hypothetical protein
MWCEGLIKWYSSCGRVELVARGRVGRLYALTVTELEFCKGWTGRDDVAGCG